MQPGTLIVAWLHPGEVAASFNRSLFNLWPYDATHNRRLRGIIDEECGGGRITDGRNSAVRKFLQTDGEWLAFVDSDMGFDADVFDRLIDAADPTQRPIVGALAFAQRKGPETEARARRYETIPTLYRWIDNGHVAGVAPMSDYPRDSLVQVDATGAACFVVHRTVLEKLAGVFPEPRPWFDETIYKGGVYGEDVTFFRRCAEQNFPIFVHTGVKTSHYKHVYLDERFYGTVHDIPSYVVIPMRNRMDLTRNLVRQLREQAQHKTIFVFDNGSKRQVRNELDALAEKHADVEVIDAEHMNIHEMWNVGLDEATRRSWPCNVAILNNDIRVGPDFIGGLAKALRGTVNLAVVSPNYDQREGEGLQLVTDICADRYDGTGGLAGFAFMLRAESGFRFPEELVWWYGDNFLMWNVLASGSTAAIVLDVECEHLDGGGQTADWDSPKMRKVLEQDRQTFMNLLGHGDDGSQRGTPAEEKQGVAG